MPGIKHQMALFDGDQSVREIRKHSSIVQMSNVTTLQERKAMNSLIWIAKDQLKRNPEQRTFVWDIGIIKRLAGLNDNDNRELKDALRNLSHTKMEYNIFNKDKEERGVFSFLAEVKITVEGVGKPTYVTFEFPSTVLRVIKNPRMYVKLDLLIVRWLTSKHSVALYEFMKDYQKLGRYVCSVIDFRKLMGIQPDQYTIFTMLRKRVLDAAVQEINEKTDILLDYDLVKSGRRIKTIILKIRAKQGSRLASDSPEAIKEKLRSFGLRKKKIVQLIEKHDEQYLLANIAIVEEQARKGTIKNLTAYLMKAFEDDYRPTETGYDPVRKEQEGQRAERQKKRVLRQRKREKLLKVFEKKKLRAISDLLSTLDDETLQSLKSAFLSVVGTNSIFNKILKNKGFDSAIIQSQRHRYLAEQYLAEEMWDFESYLKAKKE